MRVQHDFAPITIRLETKADVNDLLEMLNAAHRHELNQARGATVLSEKIQLFIKDLIREHS